jgi:hypothetical protein
MSMLQAVKAVQVFQDKRWIPEEYKNIPYFGKSDVWHYISRSDKKRCQYCEEFDGFDYFGDQLRTFFPDLLIRSPNIIDARVHMTLWGKDTCRCKLVRVYLPPDDVEKLKTEQLSTYIKEKIE